MPGQESEVAQLVRAEMERLGYDRVWVDEAGNVIGLMRGTGGGPSVQFNCHLDHVDPGDPAAWPFPPYEGRVHQGVIWGRGASDVKGALATQVHAIGAMKRAGIPHRGDIYVVGVVLEERGGMGSRYLAKTLSCDFAVVGEVTDNTITRGHRGRTEVVACFRGQSVHASAPERGVNPHYSAARFVCGLQGLSMAYDPFLGSSSVAPTLYFTDQASPNVIPGEVELHLDWRNTAGEDSPAILAKLQPLLERSLEGGCSGEVSVLEQELVSYTSLREHHPFVFPSYVLPEDHPLVIVAKKALEEALGRPVPVGKWGFATDGGHLMRAGIPTIGFAPGEERYTHTVQDQISIHQMVEALAGYIALAQAIGEL
jgi:putative selenium metabolism hydrolase